MIQDSGERTQFESGAVRDMHEGKGRFDLLPMCVLLRLARHYENGCQKYGDRNWEKGIPAHSFADSAFRHLVKYMDGQNDEDHLISAIWNLCGLAWTEEKRPEMMDIPARKKETPNITYQLFNVMNNGVKVGEYAYPADSVPVQKVDITCDTQAESKNVSACNFDLEAYRRYVEGQGTENG